MDSIALVRCCAAFVLLGAGVVPGQSTLPAVTPTALPSAGSPAAPPAASKPAHAARVAYSGGTLEVTADNSSLNQILRDVARQTGMKITGGVNDERVYGKYGPARPALVLESLLDGTGSNMVLKETSAAAPEELILSPRQGGPTPPNPTAAGFRDGTLASEAASDQSDSSAQPVPAAPAPTPGFRSLTVPPEASVTASPAAGDPPSPNEVKTPEEIYQQLRQLQLRQSQLQPKPK